MDEEELVRTKQIRESAEELKEYNKQLREKIEQKKHEDIERKKELHETQREMREILCKQLIQKTPWFAKQLDIEGNPIKYSCPISLELMKNPHYHPTNDPNTNFDYVCIAELQAVSEDTFSHPTTRGMVSIDEFKENKELKKEIDEYRQYKDTTTSEEKLAQSLAVADCIGVRAALKTHSGVGKRRNKKKNSRRRIIKRHGNKSKRKKKSKRTRKRKGR